jgi:hypothetical protein
MGWVKRTLKGLIPKPKGELDKFPELLGYTIDEDGQKGFVHSSPRRSDKLTEDQVKRVERLREVLAEVYPLSLEAWIDGFLRDMHPETEIRYIEACAFTYSQLVGRASLSREEKGHLYATLCQAGSFDGPFQLKQELYDRLGLEGEKELIVLVRGAFSDNARP